MVAGQPVYDTRCAGVGIVREWNGGGFNNHDGTLGETGGPDHEQGYAVVNQQGENIV